jgi:MFS family permease
MSNEALIQESKSNINEKSIFGNVSFIALSLNTIFASLAFSIFLFAQSWFIIQELNMNASLGIIFIASAIPRILFMFIGGAISDRFKKTTVIFISAVLESLIMGFIIINLYTYQPSIFIFLISAFLFGAIDAFTIPTRSSLIPSIIPENQYTRANSIITFSSQISILIGAGIAGALIEVSNYKITFLSSLILLILASILIKLVKSKEDITKKTEEKLTISNLRKEIVEGLSYVKKSQLLMVIIVVSFFLNFFIVGPISIGIPLFVKEVLDGSSLVFSLFEISMSIGMLVGAILISLLNINKKRGRFSFFLILVLSISYFFFGISQIIWVNAFCLLVIGLCTAMSNAPIFSLIQQKVDDQYLGRVFSIIQLATIGLTPLSYGFTSLLITLDWNIQTIIFFGSIPMIILVPIVYWKVPIVRTID